MPRLAVMLFLAALAGIAAVSAGTPSPARTRLTIWPAAPPVVTAFGGATYGGYAPPTGGMITEQRDVDLPAAPATAELRIAGVAATTDPASVALRDVTDPAGSTTIREQRFLPGASTPDEILARHLGEAITVITTKGQLDGILRAVDPQSLVVEVGAQDQRHLQILQREGYVQDVRLSAGTSVDKPSLVWRLSAKRPGKHSVEVTYRAEGLSWTADYLAVLDDAKKTIDFSAWATIKNLSGATYDNADVTLVSGGTTTLVPPASPYGATPPPRPTTTATQRFPMSSPLRLGAGDAVQVELFPARVAAKARQVVTFEAFPDPSPGFQAYPATDCNQWMTTGTGTGRAELAVELDVPSTGPLPDGRVRMFRRKADHLELVSEDVLRSSAGLARIRLSPTSDIIGERHASGCTFDERSRTIREKVEVKLENRGKQAADVVVREFLWRWPVWHIDPADETPRGAHAGAQTQEYRVALPPGAKKSITYAVSYAW